jgi:hypothetical protein
MITNMHKTERSRISRETETLSGFNKGRKKGGDGILITSKT